MAANTFLRCVISFSLLANTAPCPWEFHKGDISHYWWIFQWWRPKTNCSILAWIWSGDLHLWDMAGEYPRTEWHGFPSKRRSLLPPSQFYRVWSSGTQGSSWRYWLQKSYREHRAKYKDLQYCLVTAFHVVYISFFFFLWLSSKDAHSSGKMMNY